jgi:hypothetical protein
MQIGGYRVLLATVTECIETGRFRPEHTDVNAVTQTIWGCVHGMVSLQIVLGAHKQFRWRERSVLDRTMLDVMLVGVVLDGDMGIPREALRRRLRHEALGASTIDATVFALRAGLREDPSGYSPRAHHVDRSPAAGSHQRA